MSRAASDQVRGAVIGAVATVVIGLGAWVLLGTSDGKAEIKRLDGRIDTVKTEQDTRWEEVLRRLNSIDQKLDRDRLARSMKETP